MNVSGYRLETLNFDKGLLDSFIDITFVITMVGSKRIRTILSEIKRIKPTKKIIIVYNYGFKKCNKIINGNSVVGTNEDLLHAVKYIFDQSQPYNNILILEDDVKFSEKIFDPLHIKNIGLFIKNNNFNTYSFGSIHFIYYSIGIHRKLLLKGGTHAIIYSKNFRKDFKTNRILKSIDDLTHFPYNINGWGYNTILAGQIWEKTENSNNWGYASGFIGQPIAYFFTKDDPIKGLQNLNILFNISQGLIYSVILFVVLRIFF